MFYFLEVYSFINSYDLFKEDKISKLIKEKYELIENFQQEFNKQQQKYEELELRNSDNYIQLKTQRQQNEQLKEKLNYINVRII